MSLVPGEGSDGEAPPNQTGRVWFLRGCVGLAFTLWSAGMAQPLGLENSTTILTNQVYPLAVGKVQGIYSLFVSGTFLAIIAAGVAVGTLTFDDPGARSLGGFLRGCVGIWCGICALISFGLLKESEYSNGQPLHYTPLAGNWLIWTALALLLIPVNSGPPAPAEDSSKK